MGHNFLLGANRRNSVLAVSPVECVWGPFPAGASVWGEPCLDLNDVSPDTHGLDSRVAAPPWERKRPTADWLRNM